MLGLAVRLATLWHQKLPPAISDPGSYHLEANHLVAGLGWIKPYPYEITGVRLQSAFFPPLFPVVLAMASLVGAKTFLAHRIWCCLIGTAGVVLGAYTGRAIGGRRVGLIAAALIAVYPNLWMSDAMVMSEALSPLVVLGVLLATYHFWKQPTIPRMVLVGATVGVAALARDELALLAALIVLPLALLCPGWSWPRRGLLVAVGLAASAVVVGPWIGFNLSRFDRPVFISTGLGATLAGGNCDATYHGPRTGLYSFDCVASVPVSSGADESVQEAQEQQAAIRYATRHAGALPRVVEARVGRAFGFYDPIAQIRQDASSGRPLHWAYAGLAMYYALAVLAVLGARRLRRLGVPIFPLVVIGVDVVAAVILTWGETRYRAPFEISLVLLAAVELDGRWRRSRLSARYPTADGTATASAGAVG